MIKTSLSPVPPWRGAVEDGTSSHGAGQAADVTKTSLPWIWMDSVGMAWLGMGVGSSSSCSVFPAVFFAQWLLLHYQLCWLCVLLVVHCHHFFPGAVLPLHPSSGQQADSFVEITSPDITQMSGKGGDLRSPQEHAWSLCFWRALVGWDNGKPSQIILGGWCVLGFYHSPIPLSPRVVWAKVWEGSLLRAQMGK